jgi:hypothetical protein
MRRASDLEQRLVEWGREYGGSKYEDAGWQGISPLAVMMKWHGRPPSGLGYQPTTTAADEVQAAIEALAAQPQGWVPACVIRCEYLTPGQPIESKLGRLRRVGENLGRVRYYQHLRLARVHVAGWLRLPFDEKTEAVAVADGIEQEAVARRA